MPPMAQARAGERAPSPRLPLDEYYRIGTARSLNWTPLRRSVLALLWQTNRPWGAYEIARELGLRGARRNAVSVYRILEALEQAALILPIIVRRRFVISPDPEIDSWALILCSRCTAMTSIPFAAEGSALREAATRLGFQPRRLSVECVARCEACAT